MNHVLSNLKLWSLIIAGLSSFLIQPLYAATAKDDTYTIEQSQGEQRLVVAYNDSIFVETEAAIDAAKIISVDNLSEGTVTIDQGDFLSLIYTPAASPSASVTFDYTLQDLLGTSTARVTINIVSSTAQLTAHDDEYVSNGQPILVYPIENDFFPQGVSSSSASITFDSIASSQGTIAAQSTDNLFIYTPPKDFNGPVTLGYTLSSGGNSVRADVIVTVDTALSPLANGAVQSKQQSVGSVLDIACDINGAKVDGNAAMATTCLALDGLSADEIPGALNQLIPDQIGQQANESHQVATAGVDNIQQRISNLRAGNNGISFAGLKAVVAGKALALGDVIDGELRGGAAGDDEAFAGSRFGAFVTGTITTGEKDAADTLDGYEFDSQMLTLGIDYRISSDLFIGTALGFGDTTSESDAGRSEFDSKTLSLSFYGNWYPKKDIYVDWVAGYANNEYDSTRIISFGTVQSTASGDTEGHQISISTSLGWEVPVNEWMITGYGRAGYIESIMDGYDESDTAGLALSLEQQIVRTVPVSLGFNVERAFSMPFGVFIPQAELELIKDLNDERRKVTAAFVNAPEAGSFVSETASPDSDYAELSLSLTALFKGGMMAYLRYGTELSREDYSVSTIEIGSRMEF